MHTHVGTYLDDVTKGFPADRKCQIFTFKLEEDSLDSELESQPAIGRTHALTWTASKVTNAWQSLDLHGDNTGHGLRTISCRLRSWVI
jgi:hypothetical protein